MCLSMKTEYLGVGRAGFDYHETISSPRMMDDFSDEKI